MAKAVEQKKEDKLLLDKTIPDASSLLELFRVAKLLGTTATANAWGVLGGVMGDALWILWRRAEVPFLGRVELLMIGYCISVAVYTIIMRTQAGVAKSLAFAALMFADGQISRTEYEAIRKTCLKRAGLIGNGPK